MTSSSNPMTMTPACAIDRDVLNENTVGRMDDLGLSVFAKLCGANRGAFVLDPPDGGTYGCTTFPESFSADAGLPYAVPDSANLTQSFASGNVPASATVDIVDRYIGAVYQSSSGVNANPYACDVNGLATLKNCQSPSEKSRSLRADGDIVNAVTLAGAFVYQPWATGGKILSMDEVKAFYRSRDFREMASLGVNTVQIPVPCDAFYESGEVVATISSLLYKADKAGLSAIIVLVAPDIEKEGIAEEIVVEHVKSAASFASESSNVIALQLPSSSPSLFGAVRSVNDKLSVLVPTDRGRLNIFSLPPDSHLFAALDVGAITSVADIASSDSEGDRMKMFYHESVTCIDRSPIEWLECYHDTPVYVTSGFDLAIDDCVRAGEAGFKDYGQCDRFGETVSSGWWRRHRLSLASRQLFTYSRGLGCSFSAWKLYGDDAADANSEASINIPEKLLCLRDVAAAGLVPQLSIVSNSSALGAACLNGPRPDFAMEDEIYTPTLVPHDCGKGWWNATAGQCDYWVPPPEEETPIDYRTLVKGAAAGAFVALVLAWVVKKLSRNDEGYLALP
eukprot:CAMPEP_0172570188 /NCGR_PEP_ID=MMETSP1067-20121228/126575_1 /TAXON_ID=265564 ORGANISM="Thalassiosira punctigera, Strain Tpunct2005C2" /NCGR_SAMPLE_ID=MMETSP1067 /ASSEMBLY_ACC=CAM_ASM_000444 /LENGTH=563 /DNA_ID=CAMNT_0013362231 /DNA_START=106 /DNA_END=1797 /DNA_ORIENTATION=+